MSLIIKNLWKGVPPTQAVPFSLILGSWDSKCGKKAQELKMMPSPDHLPTLI